MKTRMEYAEDTINQRIALADLAVRIFAAAVRDAYDEKTQKQWMKRSVELAFDLAEQVAQEDIKRHGHRIDSD